MDMNGNIVLHPDLPDLLAPAPALLACSTLLLATLLGFVRAFRHTKRRYLWLAFSSLLLLLFMVAILPAL